MQFVLFRLRLRIFCSRGGLRALRLRPIEQQARSTERAKVRRTRLSKNVFERSELFLRPLHASTADAHPKGLLLWAQVQSA